MMPRTEYDSMSAERQTRYRHSLSVRISAITQRMMALSAERAVLQKELDLLRPPVAPVPLPPDVQAKVRVVHAGTRRTSTPRIVLRRISG